MDDGHNSCDSEAQLVANGNIDQDQNSTQDQRQQSGVAQSLTHYWPDQIATQNLDSTGPIAEELPESASYLVSLLGSGIFVLGSRADKQFRLTGDLYLTLA